LSTIEFCVSVYKVDGSKNLRRRRSKKDVTERVPEVLMLRVVIFWPLQCECETYSSLDLCEKGA